MSDFKRDVSDVKHDMSDVKMEVDSVKVLNSDSELSDKRTIDGYVRENLQRVIRKRSWSGCSDNSYESDDSLQPVEVEFEKFINEVNKKWLHFRPKTPPPSPPYIEKPSNDQFPIPPDLPITVELTEPSEGLTFRTTEFTLNDLYGDVTIDMDNGEKNLDTSGDDLLVENLGLTEAQVESILSETDLKALVDVDLTKDDKKLSLSDDLLEDLTDSFLYHGQSQEGRTASGQRRDESFGSTSVQVTQMDKEPVYIDKLVPETPKVEKLKNVEKCPVPTSKIIVEEVNEVKVEKKKNEEVVVVKNVVKNSPLKKHIIASAQRREVVISSDSSHVTHTAPHIVTVAVSDSLKVRLQNQGQANACSTAGTVVGLLQNGPFTAVALPVHNAQHREIGSATVASVANVVTAGTGKIPNVSMANVANVSMANVANVSMANVANVSMANVANRRVTPFVQLAPALAHKPLQIHHPSVVVAPQMHHVTPSKLKVLHAHPLSHTQRAQLIAQNRSIAQLPAVVSLAALGDAKPPALLKTPGSVAQFFEIKSGQLAKGPHLVNVLRQPPPVKTSVARLDFDAKKRQVVFDGTLKGNVTATTRHRVSVSLDGRQIVRAALPVRPPLRQHFPQVQLKNRTIQVTTPIARSSSEPSTSISMAQTKTASIPSSVVANLLQKNVLPKGQKIAISGPGGQALSANVQAIAITTAQLKARQGRLIAQPRPNPVAEIVEASTAPTTSTNTNMTGDLTPEENESTTNGVRRRPTDTLPMEVT